MYREGVGTRAGSLDSGDGCEYENTLKTTKLHAFNGELWYVNNISI